MNKAPIQLLQVFFSRVHVELDEAHAPPEPPNPLTDIFVFDGVGIHTEISSGEIEPVPERGRAFLITLRVRVDNAASDSGDERKFCPYQIDVEAKGVVIVLNGTEKMAPAEDLATVNGASLLWSSIREQVLTLTSRMQAGPVTLPTVNFLNLRSGDSPREEGNSAPPEAAKKARSAKLSTARQKKR